MSLLIYFIVFFVIIVCIYWFYTNVLLKLRSLEKYIENFNDKEINIHLEKSAEENKDSENSENNYDNDVRNLEGSLFDSNNSEVKSKDSLDGSANIDISSMNSSIGNW